MRKTALTFIFFLNFLSLLLFVPRFSHGAVMPSTDILGQIPLPGSDIVRITVDSEGTLYAADSYRDRIHVISNNGVIMNSFKVRGPLGIAVADGKIFVGSRKEKDVSVYDSSGAFLYRFGSGELTMPSGIEISDAGIVYVTDSKENKVKVYDLSGEFLYSFGNLSFPTGIAVDDSAGEVYVSDHNNVYVRVYGIDGTLKRSIYGKGSIWGNESGKFLRPQGIALDAERMYLAASYHSGIAVFDKASNFLGHIGYYGTDPGTFRIPTDVAFDPDGKLFVANSNNQRIEVLGIDAYTNLTVSPSSLDFSLFNGGTASVAQVTLNTNNPVAWTAIVSDPWVSVSPSAGDAPQTISVTVNPEGLETGSHISDVKFMTPNGTATVLRVSCEVKPSLASLKVVPSEVSFKYQLNAMDYPSRDLIISSTGTNLTWSADASQSWISLGSSSGTAPSTLPVSLNDNISSLGPGSYEGKVTVAAGAAQGSPADVAVTIRVIYAGTVTVNSNVEQSSFSIDGPAGYTGSGLSWSHDEVVPGRYTISFAHVPGYIKPHTRSFIVETGREVTIDAVYRPKSVAAHIVAGSGSPKDKEVAVISSDGLNIISSFIPTLEFANEEGVEVCPADLEGNGIDEVLLKDKDGNIVAYAYDGSQIASLTVPSHYIDVNMTAGDIDNDGMSELLVGYYDPQSFVNEYPVRRIKVYKFLAGAFEDGGILFEEVSKVSSDFSLAVGDIDADGILELLLADVSSLSAFDLPGGLETNRLWEIGYTFKSAPKLATGDLNDDGMYEITLSVESGGGVKGDEGLITILDGAGNNYNISINPFGDLGVLGASSVAMGDIDGDGMDEILAGTGTDSKHAPLIRVFESSGEFTGLEITPMDGKNGVNIGVGRFR